LLWLAGRAKEMGIAGPTIFPSGCRLQLDFQLGRISLPRQIDIAGYSPKLLL
jgi:hypothetical protein